MHEEDSNEVGGSCLAKPSCGQVLWVKKYGPMMSISSFKDLIIYSMFFFQVCSRKSCGFENKFCLLSLAKSVFLKQRLFVEEFLGSQSAGNGHIRHFLPQILVEVEMCNILESFHHPKTRPMKLPYIPSLNSGKQRTSERCKGQGLPGPTVVKLI